MTNNDFFEFERTSVSSIDGTSWYRIILKQTDPRIKPNVTIRQFCNIVASNTSEYGEIRIHYFDPKLDLEYASLDEKYRIAKLDFRDKKGSWTEEPKIPKEELWNKCIDEYADNKANCGWSYGIYDIWCRK